MYFCLYSAKNKSSQKADVLTSDLHVKAADPKALMVIYQGIYLYKKKHTLTYTHIFAPGYYTLCILQKQRAHPLCCPPTVFTVRTLGLQYSQEKSVGLSKLFWKQMYVHTI